MPTKPAPRLLADPFARFGFAGRGAPSLGLLAILASGAAHADEEGTPQMGVTQKLQEQTILNVDILKAGESFVWTATVPNLAGVPQPVSIEVFDPAGVSVGIFASGAVVNTPVIGTYTVEIVGKDTDADADLDPDLMANWSIKVNGAFAGRGRVWSQRWWFSAASFSEIDAFEGSWYALVDGGSPTSDAVVELDATGFVGRVYQIIANSQGVTLFPGRSVSTDDGDSIAKYPVYLLPPETASYNPITPVISNSVFDPGICDGVAPLLSTGNVEFDSTVDGTIHFVCDINEDGVFDFTDDGDVHIQVDAFIGANSVEWDGTFDTGESVPPGDYECEVILTVGEFHYVANDVESSYEGFRLFQVNANQTRTGLDMYWNDSLIQATDVLMPNGQFGLEATGPAGINSGIFGAAAVPNVNSRSWGNFTSASKGNDSLADTYTWVADDRERFTITVLNTNIDTDGDDLPDAQEECTYATLADDVDTDNDGLTDGEEVLIHFSDPLNPDSDFDGVPDGEEVTLAGNPKDSDGDLINDILDPDDDGDGVPTLDEVANSVASGGNTDGDSKVDWLDVDDDNDGILTIDEDAAGNGGANDDTDGDGAPDYIDTDDDGDGIFTDDELIDSVDANFDTDGDGVPNPYDVDDDGDGVMTAVELAQISSDLDSDGMQNWVDTDDDGDGVPTLDEDLDGDGDPTNDDFDAAYGAYGPLTADGIANWLDQDDDGDGVPTIDEIDPLASVDTDGDGDSDEDGAPDYLDWDDDGDSIPTFSEDVNGDNDNTDDSDGDGIWDYLDTDDDGDTILTIDEGNGNIDPAQDNLGNWLDLDSDGDGILDEDEARLDTDGDGKDDNLETDDDGDGVPTVDERDLDSDVDGTDDNLDVDDDGDGILTKVEGQADFDEDGTGNWLDDDSDGDTWLDADEGDVDSDSDGDPDFLDLDDDNDSVLSADEAAGDTDGDGADDRVDDDDDGDTIPTAQEKADGEALTESGAGEPADGTDADGDGVPNWQDTDSDGDTNPDATDGLGDTDEDGVINYLDPTDLVPEVGWYKGGTGCDTTRGGSAGWALGILAMLTLRRRQR